MAKNKLPDEFLELNLISYQKAHFISKHIFLYR